MVFGTIGAIGDGMSTNCLLLFASRLMNNLGYGQNQTQQNNNHGNWMDEVEKVCLL
jgi:ATP-binding cassette subfamily B (MDR/TAP) protein 1